MFTIGKGATVKMLGTTLEKIQYSPNFYIYCTAHEYNESAMRDFGYDCCVIIEQLEKIFKYISKSLKHKAQYQGSYKCEYQPRRLPHNIDSGGHPSLVKEFEYSYQKEVRSIWIPIKKNIEAIVIKSNNLKKYCRVVKSL